MAMKLTRRSFVAGTGGAVVLSMGYLGWRSLQNGAPPPSVPGVMGAAMPPVGYQSFEEVWRAKWSWDSVAKGTHFVNCWYQRGCNWDVYVKDGIVWREEQSGT